MRVSRAVLRLSATLPLLSACAPSKVELLCSETYDKAEKEYAAREAVIGSMSMLQLAASIDPVVYKRYDAEKEEELVQQMGVGGFSRVNRGLRGAAIFATLNPQCDKVATVDVVDKESSPTSIHYFVDCLNEVRIFVDEADAESAEVMSKQNGLAQPAYWRSNVARSREDCPRYYRNWNL